MRQKFSRAEPVHEVLINIQFQIGDAVADTVYFFEQFTGFKDASRAAEAAVSQCLIAVQR